MTHPGRALYNRVYNRTTVGLPGCIVVLGALSGLFLGIAIAIVAIAR